METCKLKRKEERQKEVESGKEKSFNDYNWVELFQTGNLKNLRVWELDKYLDHFMLKSAKNFKKQQKIWSIQKHIASAHNVEQGKEVCS